MLGLKEKIRGIMERLQPLSPVKVFIFGGSLVDKNPRKDIDIGIMAKEGIPAHLFFDIEDELNNLPIFQKIDLVDFNEVSDDFKEIALQHIEVIYEN